jgi:hypothetical protein
MCQCFHTCLKAGCRHGAPSITAFQALALADVMHGQRGMTFRKRLLSKFD